MNRRHSALAIVAALALLVPAATAGAGPAANKSGEELVVYQTTGKLELGKKITYQIACGAPAGQFCQLEVTNKLKLKGPDLGPLTSTGDFPGGQAIEVFIELNKGARLAAKRKIKAAKVASTITATNLTTGEVDFDEQTFRLKK